MSEPRTPTLHVPIESRTSVEAKAIRILLERRLTVLLCKGPRIFAEVRGTDSIHHCGFTDGRWFCGCDNPRRCSHLVALQHVCVRPTDA